MSTAALWSGWQAFRSGPLPGPLAPAAPSPVGGPLDTLIYAGGTEHYYFFYPANHETLGIQPGLINEVMAHVEDDYALLEEYFGASYPALTQIYVQIYDGTGGGSFSILPGDVLLISIRDNQFPYPETLRTMIFHETAHAFEWQTDLASGVAASDDTGWFFAEQVGGTRSETLCRFLHSVFLADQLGAAGSGWISGDAYGTTQSWLNSARTDYVNTAATSASAPSAITGCGVLFLYYLRDQLGYTIPQIIEAGRLADTLADIYETLTGDSADPFPAFKGLVDGAFPSNLRAGISGENPENPFPIGAPILTDTLPGTILIVQAAWGADIDLASTLWSWDDITRDVRQSDGNTITLQAGRQDEASETQPAQATLLLDNRDGRYALGGQNPLYPYLRRNTPIRVSVSLNYGVTWTVLFFGYADGWSPDWDATGRDAVVRLSASGVLRRLLQGEPPSISPYRRYIEAATATLPIVYWPMEDAEGSTSFAAAVGDDGTGQYALTANADFAPPKAAANTDFIASFPLPTLGGCELYGPIPWRTATGTLSVSTMISFPDSGITSRQPILFLDVSGSSDWWYVLWQDPGDLVIICEDRYGTLKVEDGHGFGGLAGRRGILQLDLVQDGSDVDYTLSWLDIDARTLGAGVGTCTSRTLGRGQAVYLNTYVDDFDDGVAPDEIITPSSAELVFGHTVVRDTVVSLAGALPDLIGRAGEGTGNRLARLLTEGGQTIEVYTPTFLPATPAAVEAEVMGPQTISPLLDLLREVEAVDGGILFDGYGKGLTFMPRVSRLARPASLILDVAEGHLLDPFHPDDDDQHTVNRVTVQRPAGGPVTAEDVDGPLGSATIGLYESSVDVNVHTDAGAAQQAAWRVHLGTVPGYRYPEITFDLAKSPELAINWVGRPIGMRLDVVNLLDARTQHPGGELALGLEGFTQQIDQKRWVVTANCSLFDPWLVGQLPPVAGAADGPVHVDTTASVLAQFTAAGATELRVTATDGPDWTSDPADYPLVLDVGGMPVTVESCTPPTEVGAVAPVVVGNQLEDDFDDNTRDTVLWPFTSGTVAESGGQALITAVAAGTNSYYESDAIYALADSTLTARMTPATVASSANATTVLSMYNAGGQGGYTTAIQLYGQAQPAGVYVLGMVAAVNGQTAFNVVVAWSPETYPWVRLRELDGITALEASADGVQWLTTSRQTTPVALREATRMSVSIEASRTAAASAGEPAEFDDLTLTRTTREGQTFTVGGGLVMDDFADGIVNERIWTTTAGTYSEPGDGTVQATATIDQAFNGLITDGRYNLVNTSISAKVAPPSAEDSVLPARGILSAQIGAATSYSIQAYVDSVNDLYGWYSVAAGVLVWHQFGPLSGNPYEWLQIRGVGDTVQLLISPDGVDWVLAAEQALNVSYTVISSTAFGVGAQRGTATLPGTPAVISDLRIERTDVDTMLTAKPAGSAVKLWRPPILAL